MSHFLLGAAIVITRPGHHKPSNFSAPSARVFSLGCHPSNSPCSFTHLFVTDLI
jgi:hypothetical protein